MPGFQSFFRFLHHFVFAKLATSSTRVKDMHLRVTLVIYLCILLLVRISVFENHI